MRATTLFLTIGIIAVAFFLVIYTPVVITAWRGSSRGTSKREKELENALEDFREMAYEFRETDSGLAYALLDKVKELKGERRELK